ncbi:MAG: ATP-dependent metallopeptidase FtsH/Yme1/Tma family protein, partial [Clostridiales bacterium]|nr:ATP-dependent metallopeptidase FtsH/Yme1/Tma family protein [Clostridiales bacterium]
MNKNKFQGIRKPPVWVVIIIVFLILSIVLNFTAIGSATTSLEITYDEFLELIEGGFADSVYMEEDQIQVTLKEDVTVDDIREVLSNYELSNGSNWFTSQRNYIFYTGRIEDADLVATLREYDV